MSPGLPRPLQAYIAISAVAGIGWLIFLISRADWTTTLTGEVVLFYSLVVLAGYFPMPVAPKIKADVSTAVMFGATLLLEPGAAALAGAAGVVSYMYLLRFSSGKVTFPMYLLRFSSGKVTFPWYKYPFNAGATSIYVGLAALVFHSLTPGASLFTPTVIATAAVMYFANTFLVIGAASLQLSLNPVRFWWIGTRDSGAAELSLFAFGFIGAVAYNESPWTIGALIIPVALVRIAFASLGHANMQLQGAKLRLEGLQGEIANHAKLASVGAISLDIAHQVKNPLAILIGRIEMLQEKMPESSPERRHLDIAMEACQHLQELTVNFTAVASRKKVCLDIRDLLGEAYGMAGLHTSKVIDSKWEYQDELPKVEGNPVLLREALSNVFSNAIDAVNERGVLHTTAVQVNGDVVACISDNGDGIPVEFMDRLFEPFQTTKATGSGLGLFAAKHIVELHHGRLEVESEKGRGTSVKVTLPALKAGAETEEGSRGELARV